MPRGRTARTTALLLVATGPWLVGCGDGDASTASPTPIVIPGSTVTIGTEAVAPTTQASATTEPAPSASPTPTRSPRPTAPSSPGPESVATAEDLLAVVAAAVQGERSVHLSVGTGEDVVIEADHQYLGGDYVAVLTATADPVEVRRVDDAFYVRAAPDEPFAVVAPGTDLGSGILSALPAWDVVGDLAAVLSDARDFAVAGPGEVGGTPVRTFTFAVDAAALVDGATVPDDLTGEVRVAFSVGADGLPVRVDEGFVDSVRLLRTDYRAWGAPVEVAAP